MTLEEALNEFKELEIKYKKMDIRNDDVHIAADYILLDFLESQGFKELCDACNNLENVCGGFWYS